MAGILDFLQGSRMVQPALTVPSDGGSMTDLVQGAPPSAPQSDVAAPSNSPGFLAQNPMLAQMLMTAFASLAGNRTNSSLMGKIGTAASDAGRAGMLGMAQQKEDKLHEQARTDTQSQQAQQNRRADSADERAAGADARAAEHEQFMQGTLLNRQGIDERRIAVEEANSEATRAHTGAQTQNVTEKTGQLKAMMPAELAKLKKSLDVMDVNIKHSQTDIERSKLQQQRDKLQLKLDTQYAPGEREANATTKATEAASGQMDVSTKAFNLLTASEKRERFNKMTPEEQKNADLGIKPKSPVDQQKSFADYLTDRQQNGDTRPMPKIYDEWLQIKRSVEGAGPTPSAANMEAWTKARNSVPVGGVYTGPDGVARKRVN